MAFSWDLEGAPTFQTPWGKDADLAYPLPPPPAKAPSSSLAVKLASHIIHFHQRVLSPVDGPRSHFRPSSSQYMLHAIEKYGFFQGFAMGCDRLMREDNNPWVYRTIETEEGIYKYNPVP